MLTGLDDPSFRPERAEIAAVRRGQAGAMITNIFATGNPEKISVWLEEQRVWLKRSARLAEGDDHGREIDRISAARFTAGLVRKKR